MFLMYEADAMNYEALGRYVEAKEQAEKFAISLHNSMSSLSRLANPTSGVSHAGHAREFDFAAIRKHVADAEATYSSMLASISAANHEAPQCGREIIKIQKW